MIWIKPAGNQRCGGAARPVHALRCRGRRWCRRPVEGLGDKSLDCRRYSQHMPCFWPWPSRASRRL